MSADDDCSICLEEISLYSRHLLGCGHVFHTKCIQNWIQCSGSCALCRKRVEFSENYLFDIGEFQLTFFESPNGMEHTEKSYDELFDFLIKQDLYGVQSVFTLDCCAEQSIDLSFGRACDYVYDIEFYDVYQMNIHLEQTSWLACCSPYKPFVLNIPTDGTLFFKVVVFRNDLREFIIQKCRHVTIYDGKWEYSNGTYKLKKDECLEDEV